MNNSKVYIRRRERKDKKHLRKEKRVHQTHYTEEDKEEEVATSEFQRMILEQAAAFFTQDEEEQKEPLSFAEQLLKKQEERGQKENTTEFPRDVEEVKMEEIIIVLPEQPQGETETVTEIATTEVRQETWDMEKMRILQMRPIQEQM